MPIANGLVIERPVGAEFLLTVVGVGVAPAVSAPAVSAPAVFEAVVSVPLDGAEADAEADAAREGNEGVGLGHTLLYTNCCGAPSQGVVDPASYVPFGYTQQVPAAYGELSG